jgi:hypothetical protein
MARGMDFHLFTQLNILWWLAEAAVAEHLEALVLLAALALAAIEQIMA